MGSSLRFNTTGIMVARRSRMIAFFSAAAVLSTASALLGRSAFSSVAVRNMRPVTSTSRLGRPPAGHNRRVSMSSVEQLVAFEETTHRLTFVESVDTIDSGPIIKEEEVPAWQITNNVGMRVKAMAQGGNMVEVSKDGVNYVWDNVEGACYYGAGTNAFPLDRGLILHGGIRYAAVTAEHGLYYDTDWDVSVQQTADGRSASIVMTITDTAENREKLGPLSVGQYCRMGGPEPMSKYPVTNMVYTYTITLNADEEFVRLRMDVANPTPHLVRGEAWLPMTFPIDAESQIISPQRKRWRRDEWCFPDTANIVNFDKDTLLYPLKWPTSGIYYDWPTMDGHYHAVNLPSEGRGCAYVVDPSVTHFTKLWSWGDKANFDRDTADALAKGRPAAEYYEPWGSAFNSAFFQSAEFKPFSTSGWSAVILPIDSGLENASIHDLRRTVEDKISKANITF